MKRFIFLSIVVPLFGAVAALLPSFGEAANFTMTCNAVSSLIVLNPFDPLNPTIVSGTGTITVSCTNTSNTTVRVDYTLQLNAPAGGTRQVTNGTSTLNYIVYTDNKFQTPWTGTNGTCAANSNVNVGNVICGTITTTSKNTAFTQNKNYYVQLPTSGSTDVTVGTYSQAPGVTLIYTCNPAPSPGTC